jgi:hypothetical protein
MENRMSSKQQASRENVDISGAEVAAETAGTSQSCRMQDTQQTVVCRWASVV